MKRSLLIASLACLLPSAASAQPWHELYERGDYERAAHLLQEMVSDPEYQMSGADPLPLRVLAVLYAGRRGVEQDPIVACGLARDAEAMTHMSAPGAPLLTLDDHLRYKAYLDEAEEFAASLCGRLSHEDLLAASRARGGCYGFGIREQVFALGRRSVRFGRDGLTIDGAPLRDLHGLGCPLSVVRVRAVSIESPEGAASGVAARDFIEFVAWQQRSDERTRTRRYVAEWQVYELGRNGLASWATADVAETARWPGVLLPADVDAHVTMQMVRSGHVRWRIDGTPPKRGWLMLPEPEGSK